MVEKERKISTKAKVARGISLVAFAAAAAGCEARSSQDEQGALFPTEPFTTQPTEVPPTSTPFSFELVGLVRTPQEIQEAVGRFVGDGGPVYARVESVGEKEDVFETLKASLNRNGLGIFHEGRIVSQIAILGDGTRVCFPVMPKQLWNPYVERHQDNWIRDEQFVISYGNGVSGAVRYQAISAISLEKSVDSLTCVNAFVNRENNIYGAEPTTLFTVLMDQNTGEIFGEVPTVYGADDRVEVQVDSSTGNLKVVVNGMPVWFTGERMQELATKTPEEPINVVGNVEVRGVTEFKLVAPQEGQLLEGFEDPTQMGWGQTVDGKWVMYDKSTGFAVETLDREYMEKLHIFPEYHNADKYRRAKAIEIRSYLAKGFFVGFVDPSEVNIVVNDEGETYPFGIIRVFVPRGKSGVILEILVYMPLGYDTESPFNGWEFAQAGDYPFISVKDMLAMLKTGDLLVIDIPHLGDLLQRFPPDPERMKTDDLYRRFVLFRQKYANLAQETENLFLSGKSTTIMVGPSHGVNAFPAP